MKPPLALLPEPPPPVGRPAAVAVILFPAGEAWSTLLTVRPAHLRHHAGQVAFPGGAWEASDPDLAATARREVREEVGVELAPADLLGWLPGTFIPVSGFHLAPVVAALAARPAVAPAAGEVAEVLFPPLGELWATERTEVVRGVPMPAYHWQGHRIWGATARILRSLREAWRGAI